MFAVQLAVPIVQYVRKSTYEGIWGSSFLRSSHDLLSAPLLWACCMIATHSKIVLGQNHLCHSQAENNPGSFRGLLRLIEGTRTRLPLSQVLPSCNRAPLKTNPLKYASLGDSQELNYKTEHCTTQHSEAEEGRIGAHGQSELYRKIMSETR